MNRRKKVSELIESKLERCGFIELGDKAPSWTQSEHSFFYEATVDMERMNLFFKNSEDEEMKKNAEFAFAFFKMSWLQKSLTGQPTFTVDFDKEEGICDIIIRSDHVMKDVDKKEPFAQLCKLLEQEDCGAALEQVTLKRNFLPGEAHTDLRLLLNNLRKEKYGKYISKIEEVLYYQIKDVIYEAKGEFHQQKMEFPK